MKEIAILYTTPMVQAKLSGRKTVTRRTRGLKGVNKNPNDWELVVWNGFSATFRSKSTADQIIVKCPFGKPGDWLWGRETTFFCIGDDLLEGMDSRIIYRASIHPDFNYVMKERGYKWKPSIFMPKKVARIWDEVVSVRVERLQEITEEDAMSEGIIYFDKKLVGGELRTMYKDYEHDAFKYSPVESYKTLWESINGKGSWDLNPFVWVITSKILSTTGKPILNAQDK
jgi:hypothetical protein